MHWQIEKNYSQTCFFFSSLLNIQCRIGKIKANFYLILRTNTNIYTLSVWALEESTKISANCRRNSACFCVLFVSFATFVLDIDESVVVVSLERLSLVVIVEDTVDDDDDDVVVVAVVGWADEDADCEETSTGLCETGSTIANGFLCRFSGAVACTVCPYEAGCGIDGAIWGWEVVTFGCSI